MLFHKKLYFDERLSKSKRKVLKKLKQGTLQLGVNIITLALSEGDLLEIYPSYILLQKVYRRSDITVVGVASDRDAAYELLKQMTDDCLRETGNVDLKQFFNEEL